MTDTVPATSTPRTERVVPTARKTGKPSTVVARRRTPPKGAIIPDRGWPGLLYKFYCAVGREDIVPEINAAQRRARLDARISELKFRLYWLAGIPDLQPIISVVNIKGGASKTTTALYIGSFISQVTRKMVLVLPATSNTATSTVAEMAGLEAGATIAISELNRDIKRYGDYRAVSNRILRTKPWGLGVVSEDPDDNANVSNIFTASQFGDMVETILSNVDVLILDGGNDNVQVDSVPLEAVRRSSVVVFTSTADQRASIDKIQPTMAAYSTDDPDEEITGSCWLPTRAKIDNSIVVVSKVPAGSYVDFDELISGSEGSHAESFVGRTMTIPEDPYMASHDAPQCNIDLIQPETQAAYLELAVACYEQTAKLCGVSLDNYQPRSFEEVVAKKPIIRPAH